jgi:hypothetical protein
MKDRNKICLSLPSAMKATIPGKHGSIEPNRTLNEQETVPDGGQSSRSRVNFINVLQATFTCADPKSIKKQSSC